MITAEILAVGSELLDFGRRDTNGDWLAHVLARHSVHVTRRTIVGDDELGIADALDGARARAQIVVVTGGLGPTADDLTREGLAASLKRPLREVAEIREQLSARMAARGYRDLGASQSQSRIPEGCTIIPNPVGSAPGIVWEDSSGRVIVLPGVPGEMKPMFESILPKLVSDLGLEPAPFARFLIPGLPESEVDHQVRDLIGASALARVTILAGEGGVELLVAGQASGGGALEARAEVERIAGEVRRRLGSAIAVEGDDTLARAVGKALASAHATVSVAESCTGGLLGATLTAVPGSSAWFLGGLIVYDNRLKQELLGVDPELLARHGAVSELVAAAMAEGARTRTGAVYALAVTGVAGPNGGSPDKPVGLLYVALAGPTGVVVERLRFSGDRQAVRTRAVTRAMERLRAHLVGKATA